MHAMHA